MQGLIGRKIGMTRIMDKESGVVIPVTVIETGTNVVCQVKTRERDGYRAVQLGFGAVAEKRLSKPELGHCTRHSAPPLRCIREFALDSDTEACTPGQKVGVEIFENVKSVDVIGTSKGRGFSGTVKRHNFTRGPKSHGNSNYRERGSSGSNTFPGRVLLGLRMAGHYGAARVTAQNLKLVALDKEDGLVFVKGAVPGANKSVVYIRKHSLVTK